MLQYKLYAPLIVFSLLLLVDIWMNKHYPGSPYVLILFDVLKVSLLFFIVWLNYPVIKKIDYRFPQWAKVILITVLSAIVILLLTTLYISYKSVAYFNSI